MSIKVNENFLVVVFKNKNNNIKKDLTLKYKKDEVLSENDGEKYHFLNDIYWNKMKIGTDCQIFANIPENLRTSSKIAKSVEIENIDEFDGENQFNFSWVELE